MREQGSLKGEGTNGEICASSFLSQICHRRISKGKQTKTPSDACRRPADIYLSTTNDFLLAFYNFGWTFSIYNVSFKEILQYEGNLVNSNAVILLILRFG